MKRKLFALSAAALSLTILAGCSEYKVALTANWYRDPSITNAISGTYEKLTYRVTSLNDGTSADLKVTYEPGTYVVELKNAVYTWDDGTNEEVYELSSTLSVSGKYTFEDKSHEFSDSIVSRCVFRTVDKELQPIVSEKTVHSTSPAGPVPVTGEDPFVVYEYSTTVQYDKDCQNATVSYEDLSDEASEKSERTLSVQNGYSYFDNEQLLFAGRAMTFGEGSSLRVSCLGAELGKLQDVLFSCQETDKRTQTINGEEIKDIDVNGVTLSLQQDLTGSVQKLYYASRLSGNNTYRNALLYMEVPLSYNLGTLAYTLTEAEFTTK